MARSQVRTPCCCFRAMQHNRRATACFARPAHSLSPFRPRQEAQGVHTNSTSCRSATDRCSSSGTASLTAVKATRRAPRRRRHRDQNDPQSSATAPTTRLSLSAEQAPSGWRATVRAKRSCRSTTRSDLVSGPDDALISARALNVEGDALKIWWPGTREVTRFSPTCSATRKCPFRPVRRGAGLLVGYARGLDGRALDDRRAAAPPEAQFLAKHEKLVAKSAAKRKRCKTPSTTHERSPRAVLGDARGLRRTPEGLPRDLLRASIWGGRRRVRGPHRGGRAGWRFGGRAVGQERRARAAVTNSG